MYDYMGTAIEKHGPEMVGACSKVVAYEMTDEKKTIVIDLKSSPNGQIFMKQ